MDFSHVVRVPPAPHYTPPKCVVLMEVVAARLSDMSGMGCAIGANWRTGMEDAIVTLNSLDEEELLDEFIACCSSRVWASQLVAARPYSGSNDLLAKSDASWDRVQADDVLEVPLEFLVRILNNV